MRSVSSVVVYGLLLLCKKTPGFPMASKVHLIAYQPINNEEQGLLQKRDGRSNEPGSLETTKQCFLKNILETFRKLLVLCSLTFA